MKLKNFFITLMGVCMLASTSFAQNDAKEKGYATITKHAAQAQVEFLSSDWMEGRATGQKGEFIAADYIASMFKLYGLEGGGDEAYTKLTTKQRWDGQRSEKYNSFFQNLYIQKELESSSSLSLSAKNGIINTFEKDVDFSLYGPMTSLRLNAGLVFVGYGYVNEDLAYDDFKKVDVKNKIIVRLYGYPGHNDTSSVAYKKINDGSRYFNYYLGEKKDDVAKKKGAIGVIEISYDDLYDYWLDEPEFLNMNDKEQLYAGPLYDFDYSLPSDTLKNRMLKIFPSKRLTNLIFKDQGINIVKYELAAASTLKSTPKVLKGVEIDFNYKVKTEMLHARNVVGVIEGENKDEIVVVGGHYDHLGMADGQVWNGADDNGSGTVGVMMLAKAFAESGVKPKKTIVFAAWTGEEIGLYGSRYFADNPYGGDIDKLDLYLNFDMISKNSENDTLQNKMRMSYSTSLADYEENINKILEDYDLNLDITYRPSEAPRGGSDHSSFSAKKVPVICSVAGFPITYHTPQDETKDINWDKMLNIVKVSYLSLWDIINE